MKDQLLLNAAKYLDPRPSEAARIEPIAMAVNIPLDALKNRMAELPPKNEVVRVVGPDALASETVIWLRAHGRKAIQIIKFEHAPTFHQSRLWRPNQLLWTWLTTWKFRHASPAGVALDLGSGGGRDAVYLAAQGWRVDAMDHLPDCAVRGRDLARHYLDAGAQSRISWQVADVLSPDFEPEKRYDLIVLFFLFDRELVSRARQWLRPGGSLLIEAFTTERQAKEGKPASPDRVVGPGQMPELLADLEIAKLEEGDQSFGHTVRAWGRRVDPRSP